MRKAERLFRMVEYLRGRRLAVTADQLAAEMEVSTRTIYRDIATLQGSGAPINGEAGVGYILDPSYHLPPIMFDPDEVQALLAGLRLAAAATDDDLAQAGGRAEAKIRAVLDDAALARADRSPYVAPYFAGDARLRDIHRTIRRACEEQKKLRMVYGDEGESLTERTVWPIALLRWQAVWTFYAWCELREDHRSFRVDRIRGLETLAAPIPHHPDRTLSAMRKRFAAERSGIPH
ncbi:MAG: YafY family protein [Pseudomonadota bacterium]